MNRMMLQTMLEHSIHQLLNYYKKPRYIRVCSSSDALLWIQFTTAYDPSNFFHLAYAKISKKRSTQAADVIQTKGQNIPSILYNLQGMFIPNAPAIKVSIAIANDAIVNVNCS